MGLVLPWIILASLGGVLNNEESTTIKRAGSSWVTRSIEEQVELIRGVELTSATYNKISFTFANRGEVLIRLSDNINILDYDAYFFRHGHQEIELEYLLARKAVNSNKRVLNSGLYKRNPL